MLMVQPQMQQLITSVPKGRFNLTRDWLVHVFSLYSFCAGVGRSLCPSSPGLKRNSEKFARGSGTSVHRRTQRIEWHKIPVRKHLVSYSIFQHFYPRTRQYLARAAMTQHWVWVTVRQRRRGFCSPRRHAPHLWNLGYQRWFYWDGRRDSAVSQALSPIEDRNEMALDRLSLMRRIRNDEVLSRATEELGSILRFWTVHWRSRHQETSDPPTAWQKIGSFCQMTTG